MPLMTRARRPVVSPSLVIHEPQARMGATSPSMDTSDLPDGHFRPVSPSLEIPELMPSPRGSPQRKSPSLGLIPPDSWKRTSELWNQQPATSGSKSKMTTAVCKRASRMARPSEPSEAARANANLIVMSKEHALRSRGCEIIGVDSVEKFKLPSASTGKGPAVHAEGLDDNAANAAQAKMNHLVAIKRSIDEHQKLPYWLIDVQSTCPQMYGHLAASAIKSNAVNSSVTKREKTQGAANQTSRINCKAIGQAAAAQAVAVAVCIALAKDHVDDSHDRTVANPMATNAADPTMLWTLVYDPKQSERIHESFVVCMSSRLVLNAVPTKMGAGCVMQEARKLARAELDDCAISERMGSSNYMLDGICKAITSPGEYQLDAVWASWVLVVYLCCHPEGRVLLRGTPLTDVDYQTAQAFEQYGRAEITRRARLEAQQLQANSRKRKIANGPRNEGVPEPTDDLVAEKVELPDNVVESPNVIDEMNAERNKVLATKRKRGAKGCASASTSDSSGMLNWWYGALRCDNKSVLMSLIAHSKQAAEEAACQTLEKQAGEQPNVAQNIVIRGMSEQNAVRSAQSLVPFVGRKAQEIPAVLVWKWKGKEYRGLSRTQNEARTTTLHACTLAPATLQPAKDTCLAVAWSTASLQLAPRSDECLVLPGILERMAHTVEMREQGKRGEVVASRVSGMLLGEAEPPRPTALSGITRSTISFKMCISTTHSQLEVSQQLFEEMALTKPDPATTEASQESTFFPVKTKLSQNATLRKEPLCTPANRMALGIALNEELRCWMMGKTRKNDPCKVLLGVATAAERSRDAPLLVNAEPPPLLTIVDFHMELMPEAVGMFDVPDYQGPLPNPCPDVPFATAVHVCGDGIVRVPEMLNALHQTCPSKHAFVQQARASIWVAMSQASYISNVGPTISAGYANSAISSSKKISVADNHRLPLLSAFDVYAAGIINVEPSQVGTPYGGTYGCCLDHGVSPPGLYAHNYRSDKRQHGNMTLSEEMADKLSTRFANAHWVNFEDNMNFCEAPVCTRGVPHNLVPGIHKCCDNYLEALETLRRHTGREDAPTVDSFQCLSFSAWSQALAPTIEATADLSMRQCVRDPSYVSTGSGRVYLPDSTLDEEAIVREPLFRRPCQASISDNPFATSYEHVDSFFNLANSVVLMCRVGLMEAPSAVNNDDPTIAMMTRIDEWVMRDTGVLLQNAAVCADVLLMLSMMYPQQHGIAENIVLPAWAEAVPAVQRKLAQQRDEEGAFGQVGALFGDLGLGEELVEQGRAWWKAFVREQGGVWRQGPLGELLRLLDKHNGSHDVDRAKYAQVRDALERSVQAAWLVASPDGVAPPDEPHPCAGISEPKRVRRPAIDPVFVGDKRRDIPQRGCLVGLKPHQLRQVCALAIGAHLPDVTCQVKRNEGGLSLRVSSAADILDEKGHERSAKSISPVQTEADEQAFGCREDKLVGCALQRRAWDENTELLTSLFVAVREPLPKERRCRGEVGVTRTKQIEATLRRRDQMGNVKEEVDAKRVLEEASISVLAEATRMRPRPWRKTSA